MRRYFFRVPNINKVKKVPVQILKLTTPHTQTTNKQMNDQCVLLFFFIIFVPYKTKSNFVSSPMFWKLGIKVAPFFLNHRLCSINIFRWPKKQCYAAYIRQHLRRFSRDQFYFIDHNINCLLINSIQFISNIVYKNSTILNLSLKLLVNILLQTCNVSMRFEFD